jgi:hypothetical protein
MAREIGGRSYGELRFPASFGEQTGNCKYSTRRSPRRGFPSRNEVYGEVEMLALEIDAIIGRHDANVGAGGRARKPRALGTSHVEASATVVA